MRLEIFLKFFGIYLPKGMKFGMFDLSFDEWSKAHFVVDCDY